MNRTIATLYAATILMPIAAIGAPKSGACSTGRLVDVQTDTQMIQVGTAEHGQERNKKNGRRDYYGYSTPVLQKATTYTVMVQLDDTVYTAQSEGIFGFGFKPTSFVVNDPIQGCVRGNTLALRRPDGKEYKAQIVRAVRESRP